jgi:hypothetical protein
MLFLHGSRQVRILADAVWTLGAQADCGASTREARARIVIVNHT